MSGVKFLVVGDPHVRVQDLRECQALAEYVKSLVVEHRPTYLLVTGDLHHNHEVINSWVLDFWRQTIISWREAGAEWSMKIILLKGNHDAPHDAEPRVHSLSIHQDEQDVMVVATPTGIVPDGGDFHLLLLPYIHDPQEFIAACREDPESKIVYCHQTFNGGQYDNGFYAKDGVDPEDIPQEMVISGHIHSGQEFSKIWYVGSPRWMTVSDANQDRFVWLIEHDPQTGKVTSRTSFSTDSCCRKIVVLSDTPEAPADPEAVRTNWQVTVDIQGPPEWIEERRRIWSGRAKIRTQTQRQRVLKVRESDGIGVALKKYVTAYRPQFGTDPQTLEQMVQQRVTV